MEQQHPSESPYFSTMGNGDGNPGPSSVPSATHLPSTLARSSSSPVGIPPHAADPPAFSSHPNPYHAFHALHPSHHLSAQAHAQSVPMYGWNPHPANEYAADSGLQSFPIQPNYLTSGPQQPSSSSPSHSAAASAAAAQHFHHQQQQQYMYQAAQQHQNFHAMAYQQQMQRHSRQESSASSSLPASTVFSAPSYASNSGHQSLLFGGHNVPTQPQQQQPQDEEVYEDDEFEDEEDENEQEDEPGGTTPFIQQIQQKLASSSSSSSNSGDRRARRATATSIYHPGEESGDEGSSKYPDDYSGHFSSFKFGVSDPNQEAGEESSEMPEFSDKSATEDDEEEYENDDDDDDEEYKVKKKKGKSGEKKDGRSKSGTRRKGAVARSSKTKGATPTPAAYSNLLPSSSGKENNNGSVNAMADGSWSVDPVSRSKNRRSSILSIVSAANASGSTVPSLPASRRNSIVSLEVSSPPNSLNNGADSAWRPPLLNADDVRIGDTKLASGSTAWFAYRFIQWSNKPLSCKDIADALLAYGSAAGAESEVTQAEAYNRIYKSMRRHTSTAFIKSKRDGLWSIRIDESQSTPAVAAQLKGKHNSSSSSSSSHMVPISPPPSGWTGITVMEACAAVIRSRNNEPTTADALLNEICRLNLHPTRSIQSILKAMELRPDIFQPIRSNNQTAFRLFDPSLASSSSSYPPETEDAIDDDGEESAHDSEEEGEGRKKERSHRKRQSSASSAASSSAASAAADVRAPAPPITRSSLQLLYDKKKNLWSILMTFLINGNIPMSARDVFQDLEKLGVRGKRSRDLVSACISYYRGRFFEHLTSGAQWRIMPQLLPHELITCHDFYEAEFVKAEIEFFGVTYVPQNGSISDRIAVFERTMPPIPPPPSVSATPQPLSAFSIEESPLMPQQSELQLMAGTRKSASKKQRQQEDRDEEQESVAPAAPPRTSNRPQRQTTVKLKQEKNSSSLPSPSFAAASLSNSLTSPSVLGPVPSSSVSPISSSMPPPIFYHNQDHSSQEIEPKNKRPRSEQTLSSSASSSSHSDPNKRQKSSSFSSIEQQQQQSLAGLGAMDVRHLAKQELLQQQQQWHGSVVLLSPEQEEAIVQRVQMGVMTAVETRLCAFEKKIQQLLNSRK